MKLYLSSSFSSRDDGRAAGDVMPLRQDLKARGRSWGVEVLLGEEDAAVMEAVGRDDPLAVLEGCARLMGESDAFFGILFERHGTGVQLAPEPPEARAAVSFFEAELLDASMTRKPICIVQSQAVPPGPLLEEFLRLVSRNLGHHIVRTDATGFIETFDTFCRLLVQGEAPGSAWLFDSVSLGRIHRSTPKEAVNPRLDFLGGLLREEGRRGENGMALEQALGRVESGMGQDGRPLSQLAKLSYLWMAVRELARASIPDRIHLYGDSLQRTLSLWNASAAWYGLHGAHPMGCLAALNDLSHARRASCSHDMPWGPRSSAYYSIGAKVLARAVARTFFRHSLALSQKRLAERPEDPSEMLQMTASAQARLAGLGFGDRWRFFAALRDYRRSLRWRERNGASEASIGEAMNAYAYALARLPGAMSAALRLAAEGSQMLRDSPGGMASGFYFRAERKRAELLGRAGRLDEAISAANAARALAAEAQAFDQATPLVDLVKVLETRRRA